MPFITISSILKHVAMIDRHPTDPHAYPAWTRHCVALAGKTATVTCIKILDAETQGIKVGTLTITLKPGISLVFQQTVGKGKTTQNKGVS